jgi:hypothetical protein
MTCRSGINFTVLPQLNLTIVISSRNLVTLSLCTAVGMIGEIINYIDLSNIV